METVNTINTRKKVKDGYVAMTRVSIVPIGSEYEDTCDDFEERRGSDYEK